MSMLVFEALTFVLLECAQDSPEMNVYNSKAINFRMRVFSINM